jgi:DNA-binding CsgD family transcriptional regulator
MDRKHRLRAARDLRGCGRGFEWNRRQLIRYEDALSGADEMFELMARALEYLTANVPAMIATYALVDASERSYVIGPCVVKLDRAGDLDARELYELYMKNAASDPFNAVVLAGPRAPLVTEDDIRGSRETRSSLFAENYLQRLGAEHSIRLLLYDGEHLAGAITLRRRRGEPDFSQEEKRLLGGSHGFLQAVHTIAILKARSEGNLPQFVRAHHLSPREHQLVQLLVAGATNPEIADRLVISPGTVTRHLNRIYAKVGVQTRTQLIALVLRKPPGLRR